MSRLSTDETELAFIVEHDLADATIVTVHNADRGVDGPVVFTFDSTESRVLNRWLLPATYVSEFEAGRLYVQIDTAAHPGGALRGQVDVNPAPQPGDVIISEIMYAPRSPDDLPSPAEWIELFNRSYTDINIGGWYFQDEDVKLEAPCTPLRSGTIPEFILRSGQVVVIIPDGTSSALPTVRDFRTAWGLDDSQRVLPRTAMCFGSTAVWAKAITGTVSSPRPRTPRPTGVIPSPWSGADLTATSWEVRPRSAHATDELALVVGPGSTSVQQGAEISVTVQVRDLSLPINGIQALIEYDPSAMVLLDIEPGHAGGQPWTELIQVDNGGALLYAVVLIGGSTDTDGTAATLRFRALTPAVTGIDFLPDHPPEFPAFITKLTDAATAEPIIPSRFDSGNITISPCDDGLSCTSDGFDGEQCTFTVVPGACLIDGDCYSDLDANPDNVCQICDAAAGPLDWSPGTDGVACDDFDFATSDDVCLGGKCVGTPSAVVVLQLNGDGQTGGSMVEFGLANDPFNDLNPSNDLPLDSPQWSPCNPFGAARPDNEIIVLTDGVTVYDVVNYDDDEPLSSPWPYKSGRSSITIVPADYPGKNDLASYTSSGNDDGNNWATHTHGDGAGGFQQINSSGVYSGQDSGSPGYLYGVTSGNQQPRAIGQKVPITPGASIDLSLLGSDQSRPFFGLLLFSIKSLPQHGSLIAVAADHVITAQDVQGAGYLIPQPPFNLVRYVHDGTGNTDSFSFTTDDGLLESHRADVTVYIQRGPLVLTEIMYDPSSPEDHPAITEWVEVYNTSNQPVNLQGWFLSDDTGRAGDLPAYVLSARSAVALIPAAGDGAEFVDAWTTHFIQATAQGQTGVSGAITGDDLDNRPGDDLVLARSDGEANIYVSDVVFYRNGIDDPSWPAMDPDGRSIYCLPGRYDVALNDDASSWAASTAGTHGAYDSSPTPLYDGIDTGSPGQLDSVVQGPCTSEGPAIDGNGDGAVDVADFAHFAMCFGGVAALVPLNCGCFDAEPDGDVDLADFAAVQILLWQVGVRSAQTQH